jgi:hypothetical protein
MGRNTERYELIDIETYQVGQFSTAVWGAGVSEPAPKTHPCRRQTENKTAPVSLEENQPSSNITLSPKITVSNSPFSINLFKIVRHGLLRAFASNAHTPILPITFDFRSRSLSWASKEAIPAEDADERFVITPDGFGELESGLGGPTGWGLSGRHIADRDRCGCCA